MHAYSFSIHNRSAKMAAKRSADSRKERVDYDEKESMEITTSDDVEIFTSFDSLGLKEDLLRGIYAYGMSFAVTRLTNVEFKTNALSHVSNNFSRI
jgi:hypothetical protein